MYDQCKLSNGLTLIGERLPQYQPYVESATAQMAVTLVFCIFVFPYITKFVVDKFGSGAAAKS